MSDPSLPAFRVGAARSSGTGERAAVMSRVGTPGGELFSVVTASSAQAAQHVVEAIERRFVSGAAPGGQEGVLVEAVRTAMAGGERPATPDPPGVQVLAARIEGRQVEVVRLGRGVAWLARGGTSALTPREAEHDPPRLARCAFAARPGDVVALCTETAGGDAERVGALLAAGPTAQAAAEALVAGMPAGLEACVQVLSFGPEGSSARPPAGRGRGLAPVLGVLGSWQVLTAVAIAALAIGLRLATRRPVNQATDSRPVAVVSETTPAPPAPPAPAAASATPAEPTATAPPSPRPRPSPRASRAAAPPRALPTATPATEPALLRAYVLVLRFGDPKQAATVGEAVKATLAPREVDVVPVLANKVESLVERNVYYRPGARAEAARLAEQLSFEARELPAEFRERFADAALVVVPGGAQ